MVVLKVTHWHHASEGDAIAEATRNDTAVKLVVDRLAKDALLEYIRSVVFNHLVKLLKLFFRAFS